jgi:hypothetical protein
MTCVVTKLHTSVKDFSARGGASIVEVGAKIIVFGGADREQTHFQDMMVYGGDAGSNFRTVKCTGDVPMPRSGHAVVAYGRFMFLFGGIDFGEEAVFNDLYILDTGTVRSVPLTQDSFFCPNSIYTTQTHLNGAMLESPAKRSWRGTPTVWVS